MYLLYIQWKYTCWRWCGCYLYTLSTRKLSPASDSFGNPWGPGWEDLLLPGSLSCPQLRPFDGYGIVRSSRTTHSFKTASPCFTYYYRMCIFWQNSVWDNKLRFSNSWIHNMQTHTLHLIFLRVKMLTALHCHCQKSWAPRGWSEASQSLPNSPIRRFHSPTWPGESSPGKTWCKTWCIAGNT